MAFITAETRSDLIELSVAMLKQAPSAALLEELIALSVGGGSLADAADHIGKTAAFKAEYPSFQTAEQYAAEIFDNITTGGTVTADLRTAVIELATGMLTSGSVTKSGLALAIAEYLAAPAALLNEDFADIAQSFQNRADAAEYFVVNKELGGSTDAELAAAIASVTSDAATLTAANTAADASATAEAVITGKNITLTTALDTGAKFTGGAGDDTFSGTATFSGDALTAAATLTAGDTLTGGAGDNDKLEITVTGAAVTDAGETFTPVLDGIEVVHVRSFESDASLSTGLTNIVQDSVVVDLSNATGVTNIGTSSTNNTEADVSFTGVGSLASVTMTGAGDLAVTYAAAATAGSSTAGTLNLNKVGGSTASAIGMSGIETLNIVSGGGTNNLALTNQAFTAVNVTGDQKLTIDVADAGVLAFDASEATGKIAADLSTGTTSTFTSIKGGAGSTDVITLGGADVSVNLLASSLSKISGFETLKLDTANDITLAADSAGISSFDLTGGTNVANVLTLNDGYTSDTTVSIESTNDSVVNNANVGLTITMAGASLATGGTALTGGTGTDNLVVIHDTGTTTIDASVTKFETMTLATSPAAPTAAILLTTDDANVAAGKSMTVTAAAADALAAVTFNASNETNGTYTYIGGAAVDTVTGGALGDTISGNGGKDVIDGGAGNDTLNGGDGDDKITIGTGSDTVDGGAGKDTIIAGANLGATDVIDGGDGTDTLQVTAVNAAALGGVTNVENLQITGGATVSLAADLPFTTIDLTDGATAETLTLAKGYTAATTIKMENGDTVTNTAADAVINVSAATGHFVAAANTTLTGANKAGVINTLTLLNASAATVDMAGSVTNIDKLTITDYPVTSGNDVGITMTSYASAITIDSSSLDKGENLTMTGASAGALTFTGGNGTDTIVMSSAATGDSITTGTGKNTITAGTNISYLDTIAGNGAVTLAATALVDVDLQNVTGVQTINSTTGATLGSFSDAAGVAAVVALDNGAVDATTRANGLYVTTFTAQTDTWTGGGGDDNFEFNSTGTAVAADTIVGGLGANTITIDNESAADAGTVGEATAATLDAISKIQKVIIADGATDNALGDVSLTMTNTSYDQTSMEVDASSLDAGEVFTFTANAITNTDEAFVVTGGGAGDSIVGGAGADTIVGGAGSDSIDGNTGSDTLTGGTGSDTFVYVSGDSTSVKMDTITDFATTVDQIQFTHTAAGGTVTFADKGDATSIADGLSLLAGVAGEYFFDKTNGKLAIDIDGNGLIQSSDTIVALTGLEAFSSVDMDIVLTASDNAGTLTTASGNDRITGVIGNKANVYVGGAGNDTYLMIDAGEVDVFVETATGGTDTLVTGAALDINGYKFGATAATAAANGSLANFEQLVLKEGATFTVDESNLSGYTGSINLAAAGTLTIAAVGAGGAAAQTMDYSGIKSAAVSYLDANGAAATGIAMDANDILNITGGSSGIDTISAAPTIKNNITNTAGADIITLNTGLDTITIATADRVGVNVITAFTAGTDKFDVSGLSGGTGSAATALAAAGAAVSTANRKDFFQILTTDGTAASITTSGTATLSVADMTAATLTNVAAFIAEKFTGASSTTGTDAGTYVINLNHATEATKSYIYSFDNDTTANVTQAAELALVGIVTTADLANTDFTV